VQAWGVATPTDITINALYNSVTVSATLHVTPSAIPLNLTITPSILLGGASGTGVVTLNGAVSSTAVVTLSSSQPSLLGVPTSVSVSSGQSASPAFTVTTAAVSEPATVTVSATYGGSTANIPILLTPDPAVSSIAAATSIVAGATTTGTVYLDGPARADGEVVSLSTSDSSVLTVPASVMVPAGGCALGSAVDYAIVGVWLVPYGSKCQAACIT
jgi:hypothetical protein